ncbi:kinase-like protein [Phaeosphaeriaceae sp. SRC1lsM3a]|nr:kinase-like protein [Stagonospora sp. SRC1lsM3a]
MSIPIRSRNARSGGNGTGSGTYDSYSSSQPTKSFLGSGSFRSTPSYDIPSLPRPSLHNYNTAQSSLASYATAPSVPQYRWQMSNISEVTETKTKMETETVESKWVTYWWFANIAAEVKNRDECIKPHEDFEPLVHRVSIHIRDYLEYPDIPMDQLCRVVKSDLWDLCLCESISDVKADGADTSENGDEDKEENENDDNNEEGDTISAVAEEKEEEEEEDEEEEDPGPLNKLMSHLGYIGYNKGNDVIWPLSDPERQEILKKQLDSYISEYLAGRAKDSDYPHEPVFSSEWLKHLHDRGILLKPKDELDWSGRGQHVEYEPSDESAIPLQMKKVLGYSATAIVESVQCRRILLARKTVKCNRRLTKEDVVTEVQHLQRLQHSHIVRVVGTYTIRKSLCILLYPAADQNLEELMDALVDLGPKDSEDGFYTLPKFLGCLSNAISFIHRNNVKHMDIKPKNILVRRRNDLYKVYIADFGIAKAYQSAAEAFTDSPTSFTRTYAAPEVILQEFRGYPADIFSLGCVFMEILATVTSTQTFDERENLTGIRGSDFQTNIEDVVAWYHNCAHLLKFSRFMEDIKFDDDNGLPELIARMLSREPEQRPTADDLKRATAHFKCNECDDGPESFVATTA